MGGRSLAGDEPPLLVEHPVIGQQALVVATEHATFGTQGRGVDQHAVGIGVDEADHGGARAGGGGDASQHRLVVGDEGRPAEQVLGRVSGDGQLREDRQVRPGTLRLLERGADAPGIALEIAHDGVDLAGGHPHSSHGPSLPVLLPGLSCPGPTVGAPAGGLPSADPGCSSAVHSRVTEGKRLAAILERPRC